MALTPQDEARGMKAYEQARAFERLRSWRLPVTFIVFALIPAGSGAVVWTMGYTVLAGLNFGAAVLLAWMGRFQWKQLSARYSRNKRLLSELKAEHGDRLPWIEVENHFAELERLKREIAESAERGEAGDGR